MATIQDRIKYVDDNELNDNAMAKKLRVALKNSETRMRVIKTINKAYERVIDVMLHVSARSSVLLLMRSY